jgi:hypothetical protein
LRTEPPELTVRGGSKSFSFSRISRTDDPPLIHSPAFSSSKRFARRYNMETESRNRNTEPGLFAISGVMRDIDRCSQNMPLRTMPTLNFTSESQGSPSLTPRQELNMLPPSAQRRNKNHSRSYLLSPPSLVRSKRKRKPEPDVWMTDAATLVDSLQVPNLSDEKSIIKLHPGDDDDVPRLRLRRRFNNNPAHKPCRDACLFHSWI